MSESRDDLVYLAKLSEQAERYDGNYFLVALCNPMGFV